MTGRIHSIQSLAASDGPGLRFAVFMQGCPLRCGCCHNPDTWDFGGGKECTAEDIVKKAIRYKDYFGSKGGITVSGGEPLIQADFVREVFELCHGEGINTCLDTSGCTMNEKVKALLSVTDRVLLDIKYTDSELYRNHVGCEIDTVLEFLDYLNIKKIPVTIRQVIIPTLNDSEDNINKLKEIADRHECVDKIELLPFRKLCQIKYDNMGIDFSFKDIPEPSKETMKKLEEII
ncbi:MAG: pyruvate formate lyase-activating protein [Clostridia bacterium]|nr:pyruvate formate lyase-activating protein [Clostridia bacterium]